jgi:branched-chain amino acid transport system ATP-binding protein
VLLELREVRVDYGRVEVLKGISIGVAEGEVVSIIGANGAGKSTTLRTISGLLKIRSGEIWFSGERIDRERPHQIVKRGIAHVPEGRIVLAPMTVLENLKMGAYLRKKRREIDKDLDMVCEHFPVLKTRSKQKAGSLSGGEQQMLAIARALMASPRLILMDEPSMGLSPILVGEVGKIIKDINKKGITIMLVEQNARMALKSAKRAYIMEMGSMVLEGDTVGLGDDERVKKAYLGG